MSLQLLRKGLRLRPRLAPRLARGIYQLPPEGSLTTPEILFGTSVIVASFFAPIMWYLWDLKRQGLIKQRKDV